MKPAYTEIADILESAIRGLMLLGRTREEAIREIREAEERQQEENARKFYEVGKGRT